MHDSLARRPTELWRWDAIELAAGIRDRDISSKEAVTASLNRLASVNPIVNAVVDIQAERALAAATAADGAVRRGEDLGPLHGVPVTIKDLVDQAGVANVNGVAAFRARIARDDGTVVVNWRKAGAITIGRTNVPAFSSRWDTDNAVYGRTWNPWSRERTAGGSSGGAAAALAVGIGALAHGTDLGGSIRYPAYCCGVAGIRPTMGRVPRCNGSDLPDTPLFADLIAVNGLLARHVRDLRVGLAAMSAGDIRDPLWVPAPLEGPPVPRPIKVALITEAPGLFTHASVRGAVRKAGVALADAGYLVEEVQTPSIDSAATLRARLSAADLRNKAMEAMRTLADPDMIRHVELFLEATPPFAGQGEYQDALAQVMFQRRAWDIFLAGQSLVVGPNSGDLPFTIGLETRDLAAMRHILDAQALMTAVNLLGLPAVAVPTGVVPAIDAPHGLPVGVQVIGPRFREDLVLEAAEAIETRLPVITPIDPVNPTRLA